MKRLIVLGVAIAALFAAPLAHAGSATDRATGGGQVLLDTHVRGAGNTIAFTARNTAAADDEDAATGQVQYVDRTGGNGGASVRYHGTVVCLRVEGSMAKLAGTWDRPAAGTFQILVVDKGEGMAAEDDIVTLQQVDDLTCEDDDDDDDGQTALARGNAQVYDAP